MGCNGGERLWDRLDHEVQRLTAERTKGKHFSEDFVIERVVTLIARLRQQHAPQVAEKALDGESQAAHKQQREELTSLRERLATEEKKQQLQRTEIERARTQVQEAKRTRAELDEEWEAEREQQRLASEKHARTWKETALRSQLCQARLKAIEQETAQLRTALCQPESLVRAWEGLLAKLQAELDVANVEVAEAKREHDRAAIERLQPEPRPCVAETASESEVVFNVAESVPIRRGSSTPPQQILSATAQPLPQPQPLLSVASASTAATSQAATLEGLRTNSLRPAQLSATGCANEAAYSTTSILNDARRALEKLEQLKVRRGGANSNCSSYTGPAPSAPSPARSAVSAQGSESAATTLSQPPHRCVPQRVGAVSSVSRAPQRTQQVTAARRPPQAPSATQIAQPPPGVAATAAQRNSASPMRPLTTPVTAKGQALNVVRNGGSLASAGSSPAHSQQNSAVKQSSLAGSVPPTPDVSTRTSSVTRTVPQQKVPASLMAVTSTGSGSTPQEYSVLRSFQRAG